MLKNLLLYYQKQEFFKKYKVVSNFQITEVFAGLLQNPYSWRAEQELLTLAAKQFLTWVAAQDTCGVTNWPPTEGLPNPDFKYKLLPVKIDMKVAGGS